MDNNILLDFGEPEKENSIIKVIGVGGGGGNAVNHMYREGIHDVTFVLCNTDNQALNDSPVPVHLQLGKEGLGAGNRPEKARAAAEESLEDIKKVLSDGTRMAFITAGMGGGTGTGAAPVIARISKEMGILTVGIVTIPFRFEGDRKIDQALDGVEEMQKHVDALLVINNERLREIYPELTVLDAFGKADDTLSVAAKSIAEIITVHGLINLDFNDVKTESLEDIKKVLSDGTRMAFITAGMGGGTGTGAAPVIARVSKEMGILTVGIVTIPFRFEGDRKIDQALDGVEEMQKHVDALLVINNERLREIYPELTVLDAFGKADDTLSVAAKSIAEIITVHGLINLDFNDVKTVLKDGGVAIMSTGYGEGEGRVRKAIDDALNSPLLNENDVFNSKKILLSISFSGGKDGKESLMMEEMNDVNDFMGKFGNDFEIKWGLATDPELGKRVKVTILATGFGIDSVDGMSSHRQRHNTQEEATRIAAEQEKEAQLQDRRNRFYGGDASNKRYKRRPHIFLFRSEDLDNDDVISAVEQTPTYKRTREILDGIYQQASGEDAQQRTEPQQEVFQGTIKFS